ncbi:divalent-cation tolerance protein CutA [Undibacterium sp. TJN25]|uniref:divalent-cation tolerance protein CutA n=1 Tax=Undibacterium sp. TJN25 TaxID=3413056 RepID=UPI003BF3C193
MEQMLLVMCNVPDAEVAQHIAEQALDKKLAACVNVMPEMRSFYHWEGKLQIATEIALMIKTTWARYLELQALIQTLHPYDVPEIIAIPVTEGLPAYLQWVIKETGSE